MAETRTPFFELATYSADTDETLTRADWVETVNEIELRAAYDDGSTDTTLPADHLKPGRYFRQSFADGYALHRRGAAAWEWMGGTVQPVRSRLRGAASGDIMMSSDVAGGAATATWKASGEFASSAALRTSNVGVFGADLAHDVSVPGTTGRAYVRTAAASDRGLVVQAHDDAAGALFTARTAGGSDPLTIDSLGRLRASAPVGLGLSSPAANIPLAIAPSGTDVTALDLYAEVTGDIPALRVFRDGSDAATPIATFRADNIALGRTTWTGGTITMKAPGIGMTGNLSVTGTIGATEQVTFAKGITAETASLVSFNSGGTSGFRSSVFQPGLGGPIGSRDLRQSLCWRVRRVNIDFSVTSTVMADVTFFEFTPTTNCYLDMDLGLHLKVLSPGSSGQSVEPIFSNFGYRILNADGSSVLFSSDQVYQIELGAFDTWDKAGHGQLTISDTCPFHLTAGTTYRIQLLGARVEASNIATVLRHVIGTLRESVWLGSIG